MTGAHLAVGGLIVTVTLVDVFFTVLFPSSGRGPVRKPLALVWRVFRWPARHLSASRHAQFLTYSGQVVITVTLLVWERTAEGHKPIVHNAGIAFGAGSACSPRNVTTAVARPLPRRDTVISEAQRPGLDRGGGERAASWHAPRGTWDHGTVWPSELAASALRRRRRRRPRWRPTTDRRSRPR